MNKPNLLPVTYNQVALQRDRLPVNYVAAKQAISECAKIDECKTWADKALAIEAYAKQANDETLEKDARRIRARAVERSGELLREIEAPKGRPRNRAGGGPIFQTRAETVKSAGLSPRQAKEMLRVANVPKAQRDALIESDDPPTIRTLAELGTKKNVVDLCGRDPEDFKVATRLMGAVRQFKGELSRVDFKAAERGMNIREKKILLAETEDVLDRLGELCDGLQLE